MPVDPALPLHEGPVEIILNQDVFGLWSKLAQLQAPQAVLPDVPVLPVLSELDWTQALTNLGSTNPWKTELSDLHQQLDDFFNTEPLHTLLSDLHQQLEIFFDTDPLETFFSKLGLDWFSH